MLKLTVLGLMFVAARPAWSADGKEAPSPDRMLILGKWKVNVYERDGQPDDDPIGALVIFTETQMAVTMPGGETEKAAYKINPAAEPKQLDMSIPRADRTKTALCIYKLEGDRLTIVFNERGDKRPDSFDVVQGDKLEYLVLERAQEAKE